MVLNLKEIVHLPVYTRAGAGVGKVAGMEIDTDTGRMATLLVKTGGLMTGLMGQELRVAWSQVVSIDDKAVVVQDTVVPVATTRLAMAADV